MKTVVVDNCMQHNYTYELVAPMGEDFDPLFKPDLTPAKMLELGIFGGYYLNSALKAGEYPAEWLKNARLNNEHDPRVNLYGVSAGQSLNTWQQKGWIDLRDPRGWFEWYCRYYMGRRIDNPWDRYDAHQIKRWCNFGPRHITMMKQVLARGNPALAHKQALLQWAYAPDAY